LLCKLIDKKNYLFLHHDSENYFYKKILSFYFFVFIIVKSSPKKIKIIKNIYERNKYDE